MYPVTLWGTDVDVDAVIVIVIAIVVGDGISVDAAVQTDANTDYSKMRVKQLRKILGERGVECVGCVEKADFIAKIKETESMRTEL